MTATAEMWRRSISRPTCGPSFFTHARFDGRKRLRALSGRLKAHRYLNMDDLREHKKEVLRMAA